MLTALHIENFTIVSSMALEFQSGMSAFTGETGAGKSILYDALMLALGGRADASVVRPGTEKCEIHACFDYAEHSEPARWLSAHEVPLEEDHVLYLRRIIYSEGRSKSYINGQPFPLQKVKALSELLVDIHGQHQHQSLLHHPTHREQLDQFAHHTDLLQAVEEAYTARETTRKELAYLQQANVQERVTLLQYQVEELRALQLEEGEIQTLNEEHRMLHHAKDYLQQTQQLTELLSADEHPNICQLLNHSLQILSALPEAQKNIQTTSELLNNALIQCDEALNELIQFSEQVQLDPMRLKAVEERIALLHQTARKHQIEASRLPEHLTRFETELAEWEASEQQQAALQTRLQVQTNVYEQAALALRASRQQSASILSNEITDTIQQLGMPHGFITIDFTPLDKMQPHGLDKIEYKVCTNPGMKPDSLNKIASGGELSRISLAIHMITAKRGATPTLLFDEVDVGIGGITAALVGRLLRQLGERLQVFCITHQPQVAASAYHHFVVSKYTQNEQTFSTIERLNEAERIEEIARMLGGLTITTQTRSHAQELLQIDKATKHTTLEEA